MTAQLIDGKAFAAQVRGQVSEHVARLKQDHGIVPGLAVVLVWAKIRPARSMCAPKASKRLKSV